VTSHNGPIGNPAARIEPTTETPVDAPNSTLPRGPTSIPVTRTGLRARPKFEQNRFVIIGAGALVVALLLFVAVSAPRGTSSRRPKLLAPGTPDDPPTNGTNWDGRSLLPVMDSGRPIAKETHGGFVDEQDVQHTATHFPEPLQAMRSALVSKNGKLASVPPFPDQWQPPPYHPDADGAMQISERSKTEQNELEQSSLVYVQKVPPAKLRSSQPSDLLDPDPVISLGLPIGTRLRARLESAVSTAVRTPVMAVIEYNYENEGEIVVPAGAKASGHIEEVDRSGYMTIQFDSLVMPDGRSIPVDGIATDLNLRPPKGKVEGRNTGKNVLVRYLSGIGQVASLLAGRSSLDQPLSAGDMMRERVSSNIGEAGDEQVSQFALTEHLVVTIPASTSIYVVIEKTANSNPPSSGAGSGVTRPTNSANVEELQQLLQLQRELRQP
jgi:hypothetical protein